MLACVYGKVQVMLTTNWILPLIVCLGPVVLGIVSTFLYNWYCSKDEVVFEVTIRDEPAEEKQLAKHRDEKQWRRAYSQLSV